MADVEVIAADISDGRVKTLTVRFKGTVERTIDRATAIDWMTAGHSLFTYAGPAYHPVKGHVLAIVEVDETPWLRTDRNLIGKDELHFPSGEAH